MERTGQVLGRVEPGATAPTSSSVASRWPVGTPAIVAFYVLLAVIAGCLAMAWPLDAGTEVSRADLGPAWPLTISQGMLRCEAGDEIVLQHRGTGYSLTRHDRDGAYSDVGRIRADDPEGGKRDLTPLIDRGKRLCH